jgi:polyhydroxyalkanoate synthesis regulator phasin
MEYQISQAMLDIIYEMPRRGNLDGDNSYSVISAIVADLTDKIHQLNDHQKREFNNLLSSIGVVLEQIETQSERNGMDKIRAFYGLKGLPEKLKKLLSLLGITSVVADFGPVADIVKRYNIDFIIHRPNGSHEGLPK